MTITGSLALLLGLVVVYIFGYSEGYSQGYDQCKRDIIHKRYFY